MQLTEYIWYKVLTMTGFEKRTSGVGSNRSTNWATTTAPRLRIVKIRQKAVQPNSGEFFFLKKQWAIPGLFLFISLFSQ